MTMDYRNANRLLDGFEKDTRGIAFRAFTGVTRHGKVAPRESIKVARNTWLERNIPLRIDIACDTRMCNVIGLRFHDTYVVTFAPHWTQFDTGGWPTMSTRQRIEDFSPVRIAATAGGWAVFLVRDDLPCFCEREREQSNAGIVIEGEPGTGRELHFTGEYDARVPSSNPNGAPIYQWRTCQHCHGTGIRSGHDFDSGGHPYFDGMRISPDGKRLMRKQPNRAESFEPVRTISGITGEGLGRWRATYYGGYSA